MSDDDQLDRVLRTARAGFEPQVGDKLRLRRSLAQKLAVGGTVVGVSSVAWGAVATKAILVAVALGGSGLVWLNNRPSPGEADARPGLLPMIAQPVRPASSAMADAPTEPPIVAIEELAALAPEGLPGQPAGARSAEPRSSLLAKEAALLLEARSALRSGAPETALSLLAGYESRFAGGVLLQEVLGSRILALCDLGRKAEALQAAKRFTSRWPSSPMAARLSTSCVGDRAETTGDP